MRPSAYNYIIAVRSKQSAMPPSPGDLVDIVRDAHWRWKCAADAADRWKKIRDRAVRDLGRQNGQQPEAHN